MGRFLLTLLVSLPLSGCHRAKQAEPVQAHDDSSQVLRVHRLELTDDNGKVRAVVGMQKGASEPEVTLLDEQGRLAATLRADKRGQATLYFSDPNDRNGGTNGGIEGRVSVGYLWGSDCCYKPGEYDPLGSWGIRVQTKDSSGFLSLHELVLADPNQRDLKKFVSPVTVQPKQEDPHAPRR